MVQDMKKVARSEETDQLPDVPLGPLQVGMDRLGHPRTFHVHPLARLGKRLSTSSPMNHGPFEVGTARQQIEGAVDGVVIGEGDVVAASSRQRS